MQNKLKQAGVNPPRVRAPGWPGRRPGWERSELLPLARSDAQKLDVKNEVSPGGDHATGAVLAVRHVVGDVQGPLLADTHVLQTLVPALDDLTGAELELEGCPAVQRAVELRPVHEFARVMHRQGIPVPRGAVALDLARDLDAELRRRRRQAPH